MKTTFALMAYNNEIFIKEAVRGAFAQTEACEIILSDDTSSDATYEIMHGMAASYHGPHRIVLNRNPRNLGLVGHFNRIMELSSGELVIHAAGDDISLPQRTRRICEAYVESQALSFCSGCLLIGADGRELRPLPVPKDRTTLESLVERGSHVYGCVQAWHRRLFDRFGPLPLYISQEDEVIPFRSLLLGGGIKRIEDNLVRYRIHGDNHSMGLNYVPKDARELQELYASNFRVRMANLRCWQRDLETASRLEKGRREALRKRLGAMINECQLELDFRNGKPVLRRAMLTATRPAAIAKWTVRTIFPRLYSNWSWRRYRPQPNIFRQ